MFFWARTLLYCPWARFRSARHAEAYLCSTWRLSSDLPVWPRYSKSFTNDDRCDVTVPMPRRRFSCIHKTWWETVIRHACERAAA
jgi:hypothetical protein